MSVHPSLRGRRRKRKSVRKRLERYFELVNKGIIPDTPYGLPTEKIVRFKIKKKEKKEKTPSLLDVALNLDSEKKVKKSSKDVGKIK